MMWFVFGWFFFIGALFMFFLAAHVFYLSLKSSYAPTSAEILISILIGFLPPVLTLLSVFCFGYIQFIPGGSP